MFCLTHNKSLNEHGSPRGEVEWGIILITGKIFRQENETDPDHYLDGGGTKEQEYEAC